MNYVWKELTVQDTSKRSCIRSRLLCGTNWACEDPRGDPSHIPPPPPYLSPAPCQGYKRIGVGGGGAAVGHLLPPGPRPHSLTALTLHICQSLPVISDGSPFYREHAPVGALETETFSASGTTELGEGGGYGLGPPRGLFTCPISTTEDTAAYTRPLDVSWTVSSFST